MRVLVRATHIDGAETRLSMQLPIIHIWLSAGNPSLADFLGVTSKMGWNQLHQAANWSLEGNT
jgi:hypothetical protein